MLLNRSEVVIKTLMKNFVRITRMGHNDEVDYGPYLQCSAA